MNRNFIHFSLPSLLLFLGLLLLTGCDNPGSVGSKIVDNTADISVDTLLIDNVTSEEYNGYSGSLSFISFGQYQDALFGDISTTAMIKPALPTSNDTVAAGATVLMSLVLGEGKVYGDSSATQEFDIYEITEPWRAKSRKVRDSVSYNEANPIHTFSFGGSDSIAVELPSEWVENYRSYADASDEEAYEQEEHGLALVPQNASKILSVSSTSSNFIIQNPEADTFSVAIAEGAYSIERQNQGILPEGSVPLHSTLENLLTFEVDRSNLNIQAAGISRAELVLYRNNSDQQDTERTQGEELNLYIVNTSESFEEVELVNPVATGTYSESDEAYHFEVTSIFQRYLIEGFSDGEEFVVSLPNDGELKSSLIYTNSDQVEPDKQPKIIITSLKNSSN
jgi:hypothetical protein